MITRILIDIDDTLNDCTIGVLKYLGIETSIETYPHQFGYNIVGVANYLVGEERFTVPSFWNSVFRDFWANAELSKEFHFILEQAEALVGRDRILLLTSPTKDPDCHAGKVEWIQKVCPPWLHRQYSISTRKQFCAHPEALLIDDSDANVNNFREWGGNAILVPRPWNSLHGVNTMQHLEDVFRIFSEETAFATENLESFRHDFASLMYLTAIENGCHSNSEIMRSFVCHDRLPSYHCVNFFKRLISTTLPSLKLPGNIFRKSSTVPEHSGTVV